MSVSNNIVIWSKKGCHYCKEIKEYFETEEILYQEVDVTEHDYLRDVLDTKYGIRHVPVVEIGNQETGDYHAVIEVGLDHVKNAIAKVAN